MKTGLLGPVHFKAIRQRNYQFEIDLVTRRLDWLTWTCMCWGWDKYDWIRLL